MALHIPEQGVLGHFFRRALLGEEILVFGDGQQLRDPVYVDDAVDAFLLAGGAEKLPHRYMNVGGAEPLRMLDMARVLADAGGCDIRMREFPEGHKAIDIGSYSTDWSRIRESLGWRPRVLFEEGVRKTLAFFRQHIEDYLGSADWEKYRARTTARV
jgi:nucleoside-diphosphate-sugar epimerase